MWYEILPSATVITVALAVINPASYFITKFFIGQPYPRDVYSDRELNLYARDIRVGNGKNSYGYRGLDNIPDGEEK